MAPGILILAQPENYLLTKSGEVSLPLYQCDQLRRFLSPAEFPRVAMTKSHKARGSRQLYSFLMDLEAQSLKSVCQQGNGAPTSAEVRGSSLFSPGSSWLLASLVFPGLELHHFYLP